MANVYDFWVVNDANLPREPCGSIGERNGRLTAAAVAHGARWANAEAHSIHFYEALIEIDRSLGGDGRTLPVKLTSSAPDVPLIEEPGADDDLGPGLGYLPPDEVVALLAAIDGLAPDARERLESDELTEVVLVALEDTAREAASRGYAMVITGG